MKRFAFTMLELVFVIIVIGILAVLAMPNFTTNPLQQAAEQVARDIRYTQHLAMMDDKYDPADPAWFRENWQIDFTSTPSNVFYTIFSDMDHGGNADDGEIALDPLTREKMYVDLINGTSDRTNLKDKYGISQVTFQGGCNIGNELSFDALGRPYYFLTSAAPTSANIYQYILAQDCNITLTHPTEGNAILIIKPETGYVSINY
ncbi:type II secretion system protein [Sulfuricurvum sp.]|uniref:pilus assembly FimT family protein n=1 Tax=Sulfuricurvum sp. TaxID=2025608 RepID=UPI00260AEF4C|nr:type II secretion system protein [Sulfuricurvum sp.]MDD3598372.1 type II secretion system protein [Sulfuricurvum sp.]